MDRIEYKKHILDIKEKLKNKSKGMTHYRISIDSGVYSSFIHRFLGDKDYTSISAMNYIKINKFLEIENTPAINNEIRPSKLEITTKEFLNTEHITKRDIDMVINTMEILINTKPKEEGI